MKIENRVEALEVELKILKNEIQSTLLEIREQILNHYYPELRAKEPLFPKAGAKAKEVRPNAPSRANGAGSTGANGGGKKAPLSDLFAQDLADEELEDEDGESFNGQGRKGYVLGHVSLTDAADDEEEEEVDAEPVRSRPPRESRPREEEVKPRSKGTPVAPPTPKKEAAKPVVRRNLAAMADWIASSIAKVGKDRTLQVVESYAIGSDALSQETRNTILQLISLADEEGPREPAGKQDMLALLVQLDEILSGE